jgi:hypothetical protein
MFVCFRCDRSIDVGRLRLVAVHGVPPGAWPLDPVRQRPTLDLCERCTSDLRAFLRSPRPAPAADLAQVRDF